MSRAEILLDVLGVGLDDSDLKAAAIEAIPEKEDQIKFIRDLPQLYAAKFKDNSNAAEEAKALVSKLTQLLGLTITASVESKELKEVKPSSVDQLLKQFKQAIRGTDVSLIKELVRELVQLKGLTKDQLPAFLNDCFSSLYSEAIDRSGVSIRRQAVEKFFVAEIDLQNSQHARMTVIFHLIKTAPDKLQSFIEEYLLEFYKYTSNNLLPGFQEHELNFLKYQLDQYSATDLELANLLKQHDIVNKSSATINTAFAILMAQEAVGHFDLKAAVWRGDIVLRRYKPETKSAESKGDAKDTDKDPSHLGSHPAIFKKASDAIQDKSNFNLDSIIPMIIAQNYAPESLDLMKTALFIEPYSVREAVIRTLSGNFSAFDCKPETLIQRSSLLLKVNSFFGEIAVLEQKGLYSLGQTDRAPSLVHEAADYFKQVLDKCPEIVRHQYLDLMAQHIPVDQYGVDRSLFENQFLKPLRDYCDFSAAKAVAAGL